MDMDARHKPGKDALRAALPYSTPASCGVN
jgi:hypothetical protein